MVFLVVFSRVPWRVGENFPLPTWALLILLLDLIVMMEIFSVRYAYRHISYDVDLPIDPLYRLIWKSKGLERTKVFLWQVISDALPTNYMLFSLHISQDPFCSRCY